ncbi:uncharacterized protein LOC123215985 isoform X1 [Mangifera indica]|uniref:uncharacterized protein LOC123215985 isoform X1 n=1 Tax=Mangifera indica TaxID=29780 RepID=UPI001CFBA447|nr:uncharacterized protein LOC123215985 isoform X1 [Mangifera indica]
MDKSGAPREPKITDSTIARARDHRLVFHIMGCIDFNFLVHNIMCLIKFLIDIFKLTTQISFSCGYNDQYSFVFKRTTKFYQRLARLNFQKITSQQTCSFLLQHQPHQHTDTQLSTISTTTRVQYCK